jgi:hypothetical protein
MMEIVPPVAVDLILDPFLLNVLPRSLAPTAAWTVIVAAAAWLISGWIVRASQAIVDEAVPEQADPQGGQETGAEVDEKKRA